PPLLDVGAGVEHLATGGDHPLRHRRRLAVHLAAHPQQYREGTDQQDRQSCPELACRIHVAASSRVRDIVFRLRTGHLDLRQACTSRCLRGTHSGSDPRAPPSPQPSPASGRGDRKAAPQGPDRSFPAAPTAASTATRHPSPPESPSPAPLIPALPSSISATTLS